MRKALDASFDEWTEMDLREAKINIEATKNALKIKSSRKAFPGTDGNAYQVQILNPKRKPEYRRRKEKKEKYRREAKYLFNPQQTVTIRMNTNPKEKEAKNAKKTQ